MRGLSLGCLLLDMDHDPPRPGIASILKRDRKMQRTSYPSNVRCSDLCIFATIISTCLTSTLSQVFSKLHNKELEARFNSLWTEISCLSIKRRKQIVLLCRAQDVIIGDPYNLLAIQTGLTAPPDDPELSADNRRFYNLIHSLQTWIRSPVLSSIILDMCRSAPLSYSEIEETKLASWGKEISVCERHERALNFDYECWFSQDAYSRPLCAGTPPNPKMARRIHSALVDWKRKVCSRILYPRMSRKSVSRSTVRSYEDIFNRRWVSSQDEGGVQMTQETIERIHHETGVALDGACEIRQTWSTSQTGPRTYFASGGFAYQKSKYIQEIASILTDQLDTTHPITRLSPGRLRLRGDNKYLRIYDLTAFTSNHWECKHFLDRLADWCRDDWVSIVDPLEGEVQVCLGDLISEYNQSMNYRAEYSLERICHEFFEMLEYHNQAGFLGIYGNINFSTFVHGGSLLMCVEEEDEANTAGDDAHYAEEHGNEYLSDRIILSNGLFEYTKLFRGDQAGAVCLKRGLTTVEGRIFPKKMLVFPSFANLGLIFGYLSPQFPPKVYQKTSPVDIVCTEIFRFLRGLFLSQVDQDLDIILELLTAIYESARLPKYGELPPYGHRLIPALPDTTASMISITPLEVLLHYHFSGGAILPKFHTEFDDDESLDHHLYADDQWVGTMTKKLRYLDVLGYVDSEEITEALWGIRAYERLVDMYSGLGTKTYRFRLLKDVPDYLDLLPN